MLDIRRIPDYAEILVEKAEVNDAVLRYEVQNDRVNIYLSAPTSHPKIVKLRWKAKIDSDVRVLGDAWERSYADLGFIGLTTEKAHPWYFIMKHCGGTDCVGVAVRPASLVSWVVDCEGVTAFCDVRSGSIGVELSDRELLIGSFMSESYLSDRDNSFESACDFCSKMCPDPVLPTEPVYGGNNWYYAYGKSSYEEIISDASLQAKLAEGLDNPPFMVIDDGWQPKSCAGPWIANEKYGDMKIVADEFKKMGVRPGIWVRFLRDDSDAIPAEWRFENYNNKLDPSRPEVIAHIKETVRRIVFDWGYELIKHDFSSNDIFDLWGKDANKYLTCGEWKFHDRTRTTAEIYVDFCKAILDATEGKAYILGCNCVSHLTAGLCHINRIGDDTSGVDFDRTRRMGVNTLAFRLPQNGKFYMVDADCAGFIKGRIPFTLNKEWVTLLAKSGTPLFISAPNGAFTDEEFAYMQEMYKIASEQKNVAIPLDWQYNANPAKWSIDGEETSFVWFDETGASF